MIPAAVEHVRPATLDEALDALADPDAKALAGGQSLLPVMKLRIVRPGVLVDIGRLELAWRTSGRDRASSRSPHDLGRARERSRAGGAAVRGDRRMRRRDRRPAGPQPGNARWKPRPRRPRIRYAGRCTRARRTTRAARGGRGANAFGSGVLPRPVHDGARPRRADHRDRLPARRGIGLRVREGRASGLGVRAGGRRGTRDRRTGPSASP